MNFKELCQLIELQPQVVENLDTLGKSFDILPFAKHIGGLADYAKSADAYAALKEELGDDPLGMKILYCYLNAARITYEIYLELGIDKQIFVDTMKSFTRFIDETLEKQDELAFVHAFWSYRHLNTSLLRVGTLEFEWRVRKGEKIISVHIPSNADLTDKSLDESFAAARKLFVEKFPEYANAPITCESWMMWEGLNKLFGEGSRVLGFQGRFELMGQNPPSPNCLPFIFKRKDCSDYAKLPEKTSLQRNAKALLLAGGGIGSGFGVLKTDVKLLNN